MLKPQDIVVLMKLAGAPPEARTFPKLAAALGMSPSEVHAAVKRAAVAGLVDRETRALRHAAVQEFLVHGLKYVFPPIRSGMTRGVPTSYATPPLNGHFGPSETGPVWPHPQGTMRGEGLAPLYKAAPDAALRDPKLHEWLALIDAVRAGRARERNLAIAEIARRLAG